MLFFMAGVGIAMTYMPLPVYSCMTTAGGRRERFFTSIVLAVTIALFITAGLMVVTVLSVAVAPFMPDFTLRGMKLTFHATSLKPLIVPSIIIPIVLAIRLIVNSKPFTTFAAVAMFCGLISVFSMHSSKTLEHLFNPILLACLLTGGWLVFVLVLRHICMKRTLVGQSRKY
jgi:hypothetical protein